MNEPTMPKCARGCTIARRHRTDCEDRDECRGCLPRDAEHGRLCYGCHVQLVDWLDHAAAQHAMLLASTAPADQPDYSAVTTAKIGDGLRMDATEPFQGPYATTKPSSEGSAPLRMACIETAEELSDWLAQLIERVCEQYRLSGPDPMRNTRGAPYGRWQRSDYADGEMVWREPPVRFMAHSACRWLVAQVARVEDLPEVGDLYEDLGRVMAQAHSLAPWREQVARLRGIACPECHAHALVRFGGHEHVTCQRCAAKIQPGRYNIWVRQLVEEAREEA